MNCEIQIEQILLKITGVDFEKNRELKNKPFFGKNCISIHYIWY